MPCHLSKMRRNPESWPLGSHLWSFGSTAAGRPWLWCPPGLAPPHPKSANREWTWDTVSSPHFWSATLASGWHGRDLGGGGVASTLRRSIQSMSSNFSTMYEYWKKNWHGWNQGVGLEHHQISPCHCHYDIKKSYFCLCLSSSTLKCYEIQHFAIWYIVIISLLF